MQVLARMATTVTITPEKIEFARNFPKELLEYLRGNEQIALAAHVCGSGQIRLNVTAGAVQSIEFRQWARANGNGDST